MPDPIALEALVKFWIAGVAAWGHRWTSSLGELPVDDDGRLTVAGGLWRNALAGATERQLLGAIEHFVTAGTAWPPALPEVRKHCAGIPSLHRVRGELRQRSGERSGFARLVWSYVDGYLFSKADAERGDRMIRDAYDLAVENLLLGRAFIPAASLTLAEPELDLGHAANPATPERVKRHIGEALAILGDDRRRPVPDVAPGLSADARELMADLDRKRAASGERLEDDGEVPA